MPASPICSPSSLSWLSLLFPPSFYEPILHHDRSDVVRFWPYFSSMIFTTLAIGTITSLWIFRKAIV